MKPANVVSLFLLFCYATSASGQTLEWVRQIGTAEWDWASDVSADEVGNIYVSGNTRGKLEDVRTRFDDAFLGKYDANGTLEWVRQIGTSAIDKAGSVSADGQGNVYIAGYTGGTLGESRFGQEDAFLSKYDTSGTRLWAQQLGTSDVDYANGVSADGQGNVYITGTTKGDLGSVNLGQEDAFISKYDAGGTLQWTQQLGTERRDESFDVSVDGLGSVYITGFTMGNFSGLAGRFDDAFLSKYDAGGTLQWTQQFGSGGSDYSTGVSADGFGNVYVTGYTWGDLEGTNAGDLDAFVRKYDASGVVQWTRQFGTAERDLSSGVSADGVGNIYVTGTSRLGDAPIFVRNYDASGTLQWTEEFGTFDEVFGIDDDASHGVSADGHGNVYISGDTFFDLDGNYVDDLNAFLAKLTTASQQIGCDFDANDTCDVLDVDMLVNEIIAGTNDSTFDLTGDKTVDAADLDQWLSDAAIENGFTAPYLMGDANLDGTVNASDLNILGIKWQQEEGLWSAGDFNADGTVNAGDLNKLGLNWQMSIPTAASSQSVPEPAAITLLFGIIATPLLRHRRRPGRSSHASTV